MPDEIRVRVVELPEPNAPNPPEEPFLPSLNAMLLLAVILLGSLWTWLYSDWFTLVSGTLGFTVLLGAVPTLRGYMSSNRNKKWGEWIDGILFQSARMTRIYISLLAGILIIGFGLYQPLAIRAEQGAASTRVAVTRLGATPDDPDPVLLQLDPGKTQRMPVRRPVIGGPERVVVDAGTLPLLERDLTGLLWEPIAFPRDFWSQPAVLLYPAPAVLGEVRLSTSYDLQITISDGGAKEHCLVQETYLGEPVWLGTGGRSLPVSDKTLAKWRESAAIEALRFGPAGLEAFILTTPLAPDCMKSLAPGDTIEWALVGDRKLTGSLKIEKTSTYPIEFAMEASP